MSSLDAWIVVGGYFVLANAIAYKAMRHDKRMAREGGWRISEATILGLALFGGAVGAKIAQRRFRHKTRKQPFASKLNTALLCNVATLAIALHPVPRTFLLDATSGIFEAMAQAEPEARPIQPRRFGPGSGN